MTSADPPDSPAGASAGDVTIRDYGQLAEVMLEATRQPLVVIDDRSRVQIANRAFRHHFGLAASDLSGSSIYEIAAGAWDVPRLRELLEEVLPRDGDADDFELDLEVPPLGQRIVLVNARTLRGDGRRVLLAMEDVTERRLREAQLGRQAAGRAAATLLLQQVAVLANEAESFEEAMRAAVEILCRLDGWQLGHAYVAALREKGVVFVDCGEWYLEDEARFASFRDAYARGTVAEEDEAVARAAAGPEVLHVPDLAASESFRHVRAARECGLTTSIVVPVRIRERVVGVLEIFSESPRDLDHETAAVMEEVGIQLGRVAERREAERRIAEYTEHVQARFAQELHDGVSQSLAGLMMTARRLGDELEGASSRRAGQLVAGLDEAITRLRSVSRALMPVDVGAEELDEAFETLARRFDALGVLRCRFESHGHAPLRDGVVATHLFRIAQEALQNVVSHAGASSAVVRLRDGDRIVMEVEDDGRGFDTQQSLGVGQRIMEYRARTIGATLSVESDAEGTRVRCEIPPQVLRSLPPPESRD